MHHTANSDTLILKTLREGFAEIFEETPALSSFRIEIGSRWDPNTPSAYYSLHPSRSLNLLKLQQSSGPS